MEELKKLLLNHPRRKKVYFNEKGEYLFHKQGDFTIEKSREEILASATPAETGDDEKNSKKKK